MTIELKPCPHCSETDLMQQQGTKDREGTPVNVICGDCGATGPIVYVLEVESLNPEAAKAWNTRARTTEFDQDVNKILGTSLKQAGVAEAQAVRSAHLDFNSNNNGWMPIAKGPEVPE